MGGFAYAEGEMHKWVDKDGTVNYSDQPPAGSVNVETTSLSTDKVPASAGTGIKSLADKELEFRKRLVEKEEATVKGQQERERLETARKNCASAKGNLEALESGERLKVYNEKGEGVFVDDEQRQKDIGEVRKSMEEWCKEAGG
jgi:hypothetical protein